MENNEERKENSFNDINVYAKKIKDLEAQLLKSTQEITDYQIQIKDRDKQLEELSKFDPDKMNNEIQRLKEENIKVKKAHEVELESRDKNFKIRTALSEYEGYKIYDVGYTLDKLNVEAISISPQGQVIGLSEQIDSLATQHPHLFTKPDEKTNDKDQFMVEDIRQMLAPYGKPPLVGNSSGIQNDEDDDYYSKYLNPVIM